MDLSPGTISVGFLGKPFYADELFCGLSKKTHNSLQKIKTKSEYKKHQSIYSIGQSSHMVNIFVSGEAHLFAANRNEEHCVIRKLEQNEILGIVEAIACFPHETGVETLSDCVCETIKSDDLIKILQSDANFSFRLLKMLGSNLQESYRLFSSLVFSR